MKLRFATWTNVGTITVTPESRLVTVGAVELVPNADTLWVRMRCTNPAGPWPWSYGILSWLSTEGNSLGSTKAYSNRAGEVFRLGVGLPPLVRAGSLTFEPRSFNLAWVRQGNPWTLAFEARSGQSLASGGGASVTFDITDGTGPIGWAFNRDNGLANLDI